MCQRVHPDSQAYGTLRSACALHQNAAPPIHLCMETWPVQICCCLDAALAACDRVVRLQLSSHGQVYQTNPYSHGQCCLQISQHNWRRWGSISVHQGCGPPLVGLFLPWAPGCIIKLLHKGTATAYTLALATSCFGKATSSFASGLMLKAWKKHCKPAKLQIIEVVAQTLHLCQACQALQITSPES